MALASSAKLIKQNGASLSSIGYVEVAQRGWVIRKRGQTNPIFW
jgi:hypothetical protein